MLMFVYGTLKRGHGNNHYMQGCEFLGEAVSAAAGYSMTGMGFPLLFKGGCQRVRGEVWRVTADALKGIDRLEGHPDWYRRERRTFVLESGEKVVAWVYIMKRERRVNEYEGEVVSWPPREFADDRRMGTDLPQIAGQEGELQ